ncbi:MAG: serine hydrolase [Spirochaetes bacterium]|nr:serine hydrolase [Spirochaetota bacterium]
MYGLSARQKIWILIPALTVIGAAIVLFAGLMTAIAVLYGPVYAWRVLVYNEATIRDHERVFPMREIKNRPPVFHFKKAAQSLRIGTVTYSYPKGSTTTIDLEKFLVDSGTTAFLVIQDDTILYERYPGGYSRDSINRSFSMAKSITSTLVGLALRDGFIRSLDDPIVSYLPELKGRGIDAMTVRDLLVMNSGIAFTLLPKDAFILSQPFYDEAVMYYLPDIRAHLLKLRAGKEPLGAYFLYDDYYPLLEAMIIERTAHRTLSSYAEEKLWGRIGAEFPASFSLNSEEDGLEQAASGFNARAIDFAKFGRLFLNNGIWEGRQVLPAGWVKEATSPDPADKRPWMSDQDWKLAGGFYKYHWWGMKNEDGTYDYTATGSPGGQIIYVSPRYRAIVVHNGTVGDPMVWAMIARSVIKNL